MSEYTPFDADPEPDPPDTSVSRRDLLKQGAAFVAFAQAPAVATQGAGTTTGRRFRALVRHGSSLDLQELTLLPIQPREVVVRVQAAQACYTMLNALNTATPAANAAVFGHG